MSARGAAGGGQGDVSADDRATGLEAGPGARGGDRAEGIGRPVVVGPGRIGQSVVAALAAAGERVAVRGYRSRPPPFLSSFDRVSYAEGVVLPDPEGPAAPPPTLVFSVPDDRLGEVAAEWAEGLPSAASGAAGPEGASGADGGGASRDEPRGGASSGVALHTSGVHSPDVLSPLRSAGFALGVWHPLTAVAAPRPNAFQGVTFGIEGDDAAVDRARHLTERVGGRALVVAGAARPRYHAAAVFASNFLVACLKVAAEELRDATDGQGGLRDLIPLARAALLALDERGLSEGVTGPVARGDAGTIRRHLEALGPERSELYRNLARELLDLVGDGLQGDTREALRAALDGPEPTGGR